MEAFLGLLQPCSGVQAPLQGHCGLQMLGSRACQQKLWDLHLTFQLNVQTSRLTHRGSLLFLLKCPCRLHLFPGADGFDLAVAYCPETLVIRKQYRDRALHPLPETV